MLSKRYCAGGYMQNRSVITVVLTILLFAVVPASLSAQSKFHFEVEVPFEFVLAGRTLPTGKYSIERLDAGNPNIVILKNLDINLVQSIFCQRVEKEIPATASSLIFKQREGKFYLAQVWTIGSQNGNQVPMGEKNRRNPPDSQSLIVEVKARPNNQ